jgi:hypothetical protein
VVSVLGRLYSRLISPYAFLKITWWLQITPTTPPGSLLVMERDISESTFMARLAVVILWAMTTEENSQAEKIHTIVFMEN